MNAAATPIEAKAPATRKVEASKTPIGQEDLTPPETEFLKGRDWAIGCLQEAHDIMESQSETAEANRLRWARNGAPQNNFVHGWIADAVGVPEAMKNHALRGFCAVLSDYLSSPSILFPHAYEIPYAEFMAGEIGADGTCPSPFADE